MVILVATEEEEEEEEEVPQCVHFGPGTVMDGKWILGKGLRKIANDKTMIYNLEYIMNIIFS